MVVLLNSKMGKTEAAFSSNHPAPLTELSQVFTENTFHPRADLIEDFTARVLHITSLVQSHFKQSDFADIFKLLGQELQQLVHDFPPAEKQSIVILDTPVVALSKVGIMREAALKTALRGDSLDHVCTYKGIVWETDPPSTEDSFSMGALWENINGTSMELTRFHLLSMDENNKNVIVSMRLYDVQGQKQVPQVFQKCEQLLEEILKTSDAGAAHRDIAALHWWLLQASPWKEGNAEAAEILVAALSNYKSIELKPWKEEATLIALTRTLSDFIQLYPFLRQ